ncbi:hypothetical protein, partial [Rhodopseudomonas sp. BR0G17]|uniref:hypothetical protein n=1 Tax=Rhodopseudomonas sp. BR0G17 TaxID=2269368 RepID=UPI001967FA52
IRHLPIQNLHDEGAASLIPLVSAHRNSTSTECDNAAIPHRRASPIPHCHKNVVLQSGIAATTH